LSFSVWRLISLPALAGSSSVVPLSQSPSQVPVLFEAAIVFRLHLLLHLSHLLQYHRTVIDDFLLGTRLRHLLLPSKQLICTTQSIMQAPDLSQRGAHILHGLEPLSVGVPTRLLGLAKACVIRGYVARKLHGFPAVVFKVVVVSNRGHKNGLG
jgi:hypothetical protein